MSINQTGDYNNDLFSDGEIYHPGGIHDAVSHVMYSHQRVIVFFKN